MGQLTNERAKTHGDFALTAERAANLADMTRTRTVEPPVLRHAREMICVKLARIASGDPQFEDHWRDIAGYATLAADWLSAQKPPAPKLEPSMFFTDTIRRP